ncbi:MAG: hypothetical protein GY884_11985, partial [Proteobacteria bacterium]|nr:hypothetical protein [Pseudomonadota bacterium]
MLLLALGCGEILEETYGGGELLVWPTTADRGQGEIRVPGLTQAQLDNEQDKTGSYAWVSGTDDDHFGIYLVLAAGELDTWLPCGVQGSFVDGAVHEDSFWLDGIVAVEGASGDLRAWAGDPSYGPATSRLEGSVSAELELEVDVDE